MHKWTTFQTFLFLTNSTFQSSLKFHAKLSLDASLRIQFLYMIFIQYSMLFQLSKRFLAQGITFKLILTLFSIFWASHLLCIDRLFSDISVISVLPIASFYMIEFSLGTGTPIFVYKETLKGDCLVFSCNVRYSTLLHLPPLRFHCVRRMLGSNPGLLRLWH